MQLGTKLQNTLNTNYFNSINNGKIKKCFLVQKKKGLDHTLGR